MNTDASFIRNVEVTFNNQNIKVKDNRNTGQKKQEYPIAKVSFYKKFTESQAIIHINVRNSSTFYISVWLMEMNNRHLETSQFSNRGENAFTTAVSFCWNITFVKSMLTGKPIKS